LQPSIAGRASNQAFIPSKEKFSLDFKHNENLRIGMKIKRKFKTAVK
jgi:RNase P protein component